MQKNFSCPLFFHMYGCILIFFTTNFFQCFILDGQGLCLEFTQRTDVDRVLNPNIYCCMRFHLSHFLVRCKSTRWVFSFEKYFHPYLYMIYFFAIFYLFIYSFIHSFINAFVFILYLKERYAENVTYSTLSSNCVIYYP